MHFEDWMEIVTRVFEAAGVAILAVGSMVVLVSAGRTLRRGDRSTAYRNARRDVGRVILLGLEVLIIADIVETITIDPSLTSALTLAVIVVVRTFLSFSLEIELDEKVPWRRRTDDARPAED